LVEELVGKGRVKSIDDARENLDEFFGEAAVESRRKAREVVVGGIEPSKQEVVEAVWKSHNGVEEFSCGRCIVER